MARYDDDEFFNDDSIFDCPDSGIAVDAPSEAPSDGPNHRDDLIELDQGVAELSGAVATSCRVTQNHFEGTPRQFIQDKVLAVYNLESLDPVEDIKKCLGDELLKECRELMWDKDDDGCL